MARLFYLLACCVVVFSQPLFRDGVLQSNGGGIYHRRFPTIRQDLSSTNFIGHPSAANCTWRYFDQALDHFNPGVTVGHGATFKQRYCVVDQFWKSPTDDLALGASKGPIFFYTGNESPVEEYVNNTGLMWEAGAQFGALLIFAEHRYEGESVPVQKNVPNCLSYCSSSQALADYAVLIDHIKKELDAVESPVIAFGGSYGGMLSSWMRFKYPHIVSGAIAASAPIWGFPRSMNPKDLDGAGIAISRGVSSEGGATDQCKSNLRSAWPLIQTVGESSEGRAMLSSAFSLCTPLQTEADVNTLLSWAHGPWFNLAEGNYPFASTYITFAVGPGMYPLPPWPMRVACNDLNEDFGIKVEGSVETVEYELTVGNIQVKIDWDVATITKPFSKNDVGAAAIEALMQGVRNAVGVWYNVSGLHQCYDIHAPAANTINHPRTHQQEDNLCTSSQKGSWEPVCCNDNLNMVNYQVMGVGHDMFWPPTVERNYTLSSLVDVPGATQGCGSSYAGLGLYGFPETRDPWSNWLHEYYGGQNIMTHSNIVFSNGLIDPWSSAGVYPPNADHSLVQNITRDGSIVALIIPLGGHHLDLFFSTPEDPSCATHARQIETQHIEKWIRQGYQNAADLRKYQ